MSTPELLCYMYVFQIVFCPQYIKFNVDKVLHCQLSAGGTGKVKMVMD